MSKPIRSVAIVGGTHGNETNGVELARHLARNIHTIKRPSFEPTVALANHHAIESNTRYVDEDLNRCFTMAALADDSRASREAQLARKLNAELGPKGAEAPATDLIIDLHNTTSATGVAILYAPNDPLCRQIAAHLHSIDPSVNVCTWNASVTDYAVLPSIARHGITFEVGPAPWGAIEPRLYAKSLQLLHAALDYVHAYNDAVAISDVALRKTRVVSLPIYSNVAKRDYPRDAKGELAAMVHPQLQGRDFQPLKPGDAIFQRHDLTVIRLGAEDDDGEPLDDVCDASGVCYPFFINEAAYYEKGLAFCVAKREVHEVPVYDFHVRAGALWRQHIDDYPVR